MVPPPPLPFCLPLPTESLRERSSDAHEQRGQGALDPSHEPQKDDWRRQLTEQQDLPSKTQRKKSPRAWMFSQKGTLKETQDLQWGPVCKELRISFKKMCQ